MDGANFRRSDHRSGKKKVAALKIENWPPTVVVGGTALASACFYAAGPLQPNWQLAWAAPAIAILIVYRTTASIAAAAILVAALFRSASLYPYLAMLRRDGLPLVQIAEIGLLPPLGLTAAALVSRALARRGAAVSAALAFASIWTAFEFAIASLSPNGAFGDYAFTQVRNLPILQLASVTGLPGIDFLIMFSAAGLAGLLLTPPTRSTVIPAGLAAALIASVLAWGQWRLDAAQHSPNLLSGGVVSDVGLHPGAHPDSAQLEYAEHYLASVGSLAKTGVRSVVLPENLVRATPGNLGKVLSRLSEEAARDKLLLVSGIHRTDQGSSRNSAVAFGPNGRRLGLYDKHHLFSGTPDIAGDTLSILQMPGSVGGLEICKDLDFTEPSRSYARAGVGIVFVPSSDYDLDGQMHADMAIARGVENGFSIVRTARHGLLTVSDDRGHIILEKKSGDARMVAGAAPIAAGSGPTLFAKFGSWFEWATVLVLPLLLARFLVLTSSGPLIGRHNARPVGS
jgi:apolipoprotein N-acyltransferase